MGTWVLACDRVQRRSIFAPLFALRTCENWRVRGTWVLDSATWVAGAPSQLLDVFAGVNQQERCRHLPATPVARRQKVCGRLTRALIGSPGPGRCEVLDEEHLVPALVLGHLGDNFSTISVPRPPGRHAEMRSWHGCGHHVRRIA